MFNTTFTIPSIPNGANSAFAAQQWQGTGSRNQLVLGPAGQHAVISAENYGQTSIVRLPDPGRNVTSFVLTDSKTGSQTINGSLTTTGNLTTNANLIVNGSTEVTGNSVIDGNLTVKQDATVEEDLTVEQNLAVTGNSVLDGTLTVKKDATVEGNLLVKGNETIEGNLMVTGSITGPGVLQEKSGSLTNTQIRKMWQTPVVMVTAPGAGLAIVLISCYVTYDYPGAGLTFPAAQMFVTFGNGPSGHFQTAATKEAPFSNAVKCVAAFDLSFNSDGGTSPYVEMADFVNQPLTLTSTTDLDAGGVGTGRYWVLYKTITLPIV